MTVSFEAVPHSPSSGVAQPQSSMKESHPAKVHLQEVDQTATASSTSNKSTSLQMEIRHRAGTSYVAGVSVGLSTG